MSEFICIYCERRFKGHSDFIKSVKGDPDGITEKHYQRMPNHFAPSFFVTADGITCPNCLKSAKETIAEKVNKNEPFHDLRTEMVKAKEDRKKKEGKDAN